MHSSTLAMFINPLPVSTVHTKNNFTTIIYQYAYEYIHVYVNEQIIDVHIYVYMFHS